MGKSLHSESKLIDVETEGAMKQKKSFYCLFFKGGTYIGRQRKEKSDLEGNKMEKRFIIITNNSMVRDELSTSYQVEYEDISYEDVLRKVRDRVYAGHKLLTHPLSGSVKPNETPYKSVMISTEPGKLDLESVEIIERAIHSCAKFEFRSDKYKPEVYEDFRTIDFTLISSAIPSTDFL